MSKHNEGFIITPAGRVSLWVGVRKRMPDGFRFWVFNGAWKGRWWESDDLLTNGGFTVAYEPGDKARPHTFQYAPPGMPAFSATAYNEAIQWMQDYLDRR